MFLSLLFDVEKLKPLFGLAFAEPDLFFYRLGRRSLAAQLPANIIPKLFGPYRDCLSGMSGLADSPVAADNNQSSRRGICFYLGFDNSVGIGGAACKKNLKAAYFIEPALVRRPNPVKNDFSLFTGQFEVSAYNPAQLNAADWFKVFIGLLN
jgi:hypothetical protein